jgi:hypothetical protein
MTPVRGGPALLDHALREGDTASGGAAASSAVAVSFVEGTDHPDDPATQACVDAWPAAPHAELQRQRTWQCDPF